MLSIVREKRAIVVPSFGERPWVALTEANVRQYAEKIGADMHVVTDSRYLEALALNFKEGSGRKNKRAYALKQYLPGVFLQEYDRVVLMDDTCLIAKDCPDIFSACSSEVCGYTGTSRAHAEKSFNEIKNFINDRNLQHIEYDPERYMNSGVMVYGKKCLPALCPREIALASPLLQADYPHQTISYYLLNKFRIPMSKLDQRFNCSMMLEESEYDRNMDELPSLIKKAWIYHFTGFWKNRSSLIRQLAERLERGVESPC